MFGSLFSVEGLFRSMGLNTESNEGGLERLKHAGAVLGPWIASELVLRNSTFSARLEQNEKEELFLIFELLEISRITEEGEEPREIVTPKVIFSTVIDKEEFSLFLHGQKKPDPMEIVSALLKGPKKVQKDEYIDPNAVEKYLESFVNSNN